MINIRNIAAIVVSSVLITGCGSIAQKPVSFENNALPSGKNTIGVLQTKIPEVSVEFPGAACLLCIGIANATHGVFKDHAKTLNTKDLEPLQSDLINKLNTKGFKVKELSANFELSKLEKNANQKEGYSKYNVASLAKEGINAVLVLEVKEIGFKRSYQNYIPTEPMKAQIVANGFLVNIADNKLLWHKEYVLSKGVQGEWNIEPKFPELTSSYYSLIEEFKDSVLSEFK
jgi:hypothetical protein